MNDEPRPARYGVSIQISARPVIVESYDDANEAANALKGIIADRLENQDLGRFHSYRIATQSELDGGHYYSTAKITLFVDAFDSDDACAVASMTLALTFSADSTGEPYLDGEPEPLTEYRVRMPVSMLLWARDGRDADRLACANIAFRNAGALGTETASLGDPDIAPVFTEPDEEHADEQLSGALG